MNCNSSNIYLHGERNISFKVEGMEDLIGYLSPHGKDSKLGLVIIQEWWGMNKSMEVLCDTAAKQGFKTLIPDLYRGKVAQDNEEADHLMNGLDIPKAIHEIGAAVAFLKESGCEKVGVVGFCMGGALSLLVAANVPTISAACCFYGVYDMSLWDANQIKAPIQCHFGNDDEHENFSNAKTANELEKKLRDAKVDLDFHRYEKTGHAFVNVDRPELFNEKSAALAWERTYAFFKKHLY